MVQVSSVSSVSDNAPRRRVRSNKKWPSHTFLIVFMLVCMIGTMSFTAIWFSTTLKSEEETGGATGANKRPNIFTKKQRPPLLNNIRKAALNRDENDPEPSVQGNTEHALKADLPLDHRDESNANAAQCPYTSMSDLAPNEILPQATKERHMVTPPHGGKLHLVCCQTTQGPWNILVHEKWTPLGAQRFLDMVNTGYFSLQKQGVPLMRCVKNFLCQFGLNGKVSKQFGQSLPDDPNWLPPGPTHRANELGVKRFQKGYFAYAGAGPNTRSNQLFVALQENAMLAGGSPWEVPWGELVGTHSYETLSKIYTGYGEKGPSQGWLHSHDSSDPTLKQDFPLLDYVTSCQVVDQLVQEDDI